MGASKRTLRSQKYQDKTGWISKSYKLKKDIVQQFAEACDRTGVSQAGQLTKMMMEFIKEINNEL